MTDDPPRRAGLVARVACVSAGAAVLACAITAGAQPPSRAHRGTTASLGPSPAQRASAAAAAAAYMDGNQPLVGLHAPSTKSVESDPSGRPMLALTTVNHREALAVPATTETGGFSAMDLDRVAHLLRAASGDEHPVDPRTLALVYRIQVHFDAPEIRVVSGYRVPKPGSHSNHAKGRAMDIIVPGVPDEEVARFARELGFVGVGVYPTSQFVHVDIRPRSYFWVDYSGPHMKNRESCILPAVAAQGDAAARARGQTPIEPFVVSTDVDAALRARGAPPEPAMDDDDEDDDN
ncbi:MAG TPA: DUF882 domain-containing protein [Polyangiaceae bacterium]|jgi:uncharacterized protein YcbK (DUF882 family)|nr:DUF882 domain-containing protein [Polyangiaceae bacterium]